MRSCFHFLVILFFAEIWYKILKYCYYMAAGRSLAFYLIECCVSAFIWSSKNGKSGGIFVSAIGSFCEKFSIFLLVSNKARWDIWLVSIVFRNMKISHNLNKIVLYTLVHSDSFHINSRFVNQLAKFIELNNTHKSMLYLFFDFFDIYAAEKYITWHLLCNLAKFSFQYSCQWTSKWL